MATTVVTAVVTCTMCWMDHDIAIVMVVIESGLADMLVHSQSHQLLYNVCLNPTQKLNYTLSSLLAGLSKLDDKLILDDEEFESEFTGT